MRIIAPSHDLIRADKLDGKLQGIDIEIDRIKIKLFQIDAGRLMDIHPALLESGIAAVEPLCKVLQIAPSGYRRHAAERRNPALRCARKRRDDALVPHIKRVWQANMEVYGADKVWQQMNREGIAVARCTVERLMHLQGLRGVTRGKVVRTTVSDTKAPCPLDREHLMFAS